MKTQVFSIHDSKAEAFIQPFFSATIKTAMREFEQAVNTVDHQFNRFAGDYTLFHLGSFDSSTGRFEELEASANLGVALTYLKES